jgi:hypothetical protein
MLQTLQTLPALRGDVTFVTFVTCVSRYMTRGNPGSLKHNPDRTNLWTARRDCLLRAAKGGPGRGCLGSCGCYSLATTITASNARNCCAWADMRRAPLRIKIDMRVLLEMCDGRGLIQLSLNPSYSFFKIEINNNSKGSYEIRIQDRIRV